MREEDKAEARKHFSTPLLFSIHEAKGWNTKTSSSTVSSPTIARVNEIAEGVAAEDLTADELDYRRAKDKSDKSLEVYKFFVNALYVALTRATAKSLFDRIRHRPSDLQASRTDARGRVQVDAKSSSLEDWQRKPANSNSRGKQEQVDAIRRDISGKARFPGRFSIRRRRPNC